ncbi:hypothetical protein RhiirA5_441684 [Rhizophagus irregularis]|uniref:Uncharacterized protein n=1 Tax=Rhizophagus irregularis TaxID=588596 RepID=A0A2I1FP16_9GLOM|nr:hypothetical protein RhiirA5_441684 [Rhizophagus irregularis]PKC52165.1 hypothetical protein RhiirA1_482143 [Rhizophagus irregularis]PKY36098.1 hypothetical protein RhiirB3_458005 [Rhizophagus irregularis]
MVTDQKHSSDVFSEQKFIRYTEKLAKLLGLDEQNAGAYKALSGQIWELEKKLDDYHSQHNTLERRSALRLIAIICLKEDIAYIFYGAFGCYKFTRTIRADSIFPSGKYFTETLNF